MRFAFASTLLVAALVSPWTSTVAQQEPDSVSVAAAGTAADPGIAVEDLKLLLTPLRLDEMGDEVKRWMEVLEAKVAELSDVEIQARAAEGEAQATLVTRAAGLRDERTAIIDRVRVVLTAYTAKGGGVAEHNQYIAAVSGINLDVTDAGGAWLTVRAWLVSPQGGLRWAKNIGLFLLVVIIARILGGVAAGVVGRGMNRMATASDLLKRFFVKVVRQTIFLVGLVVALSMLGVQIGPLLAAMGAVGFVVGFALQGTLSNFASGIMILLYRPFDVGDWVSVGGVSGKVQSMSLVSTTITTGDNQNILVPNNSIWGDVITNVTANDTRRVDMVFGIGYSDDMAKANGILEQVVTQHEKVLDDPAPVIKVHELADSSVNFIVRPWAKTSDYWDVYWDVTRTVKERFDAESVSIPFPQHDVHMYREGG